MKKNTFIAFCLLSLSSFGQVSFDWYPNDSIVTAIDANNYTELKIEQINQTSDTLNLEIEIVYRNVPSSWDGMICVEGLCLGTVPAVGTVVPMAPISGPINGYARWTVSPMGGTEAAELHIRVYDKDNPTDGDTAVWIITGTTVGFEEEGVSAFEIYPNPTNSNIVISNTENTDLFQIQDLSGAIVREMASAKTTNQVIDLSELPAGLYFIRAFKEGILVETQKISKR